VEEVKTCCHFLELNALGILESDGQAVNTEIITVDAAAKSTHPVKTKDELNRKVSFLML